MRRLCARSFAFTVNTTDFTAHAEGDFDGYSVVHGISCSPPRSPNGPPQSPNDPSPRSPNGRDSVFNGISTWDPATRTIYTICEKAPGNSAPVVISYSAQTQAFGTPLDLCEGRGGGCAAPFNLDYFA